jgi:hypothetical protein
MKESLDEQQRGAKFLLSEEIKSAWVRDRWFRVYGFGRRVKGSGFRVWVSGLRA